MKNTAIIYSDEQLLALIGQSDTTAFDQLYERYWKLLFGIAVQKTGSYEDAADLVQELFIEIWNKRARLEVRTTLKTYLVSCIYLKVFKHFRTKGLRESHIRNYEMFITGKEEPLPDMMKDLEQQYGKLQEIIEQAIRLMPSKMQQVFLLNYTGGHPVAEIAATLHISPRTVKNHLAAARKRLKDAAVRHAPDLPLMLAFLCFLEA